MKAPIACIGPAGIGSNGLQRLERLEAHIIVRTLSERTSLAFGPISGCNKVTINFLIECVMLLQMTFVPSLPPVQGEFYPPIILPSHSIIHLFNANIRVPFLLPSQSFHITYNAEPGNCAANASL